MNNKVTINSYPLHERKTIAFAWTSVLFCIGLIVFRVHSWIAYLMILVFSIAGLKHIFPPPKTSIYSLRAKLTYVMFLCYGIFSYYFQFVRDVPSTPNHYRAIVMQPIVISLLLAPVIEELGYRRILLSSLLNTKMPWFFACSVSASLFALTHTASNHVYALATGYFLSYAYKVTGNIWVPISMHFLVNAVYFIDPSSFGATRVICAPCIRF